MCLATKFTRAVNNRSFVVFSVDKQAEAGWIVIGMLFVVTYGGEGSVCQEGCLANILGQEKVKFLLVYMIHTGIQAFYYNQLIVWDNSVSTVFWRYFVVLAQARYPQAWYSWNNTV